VQKHPTAALSHATIKRRTALPSRRDLVIAPSNVDRQKKSLQSIHPSFRHVQTSDPSYSDCMFYLRALPSPTKVRPTTILSERQTLKWVYLAKTRAPKMWIEIDVSNFGD
jgi:hypothetical protein